MFLSIFVGIHDDGPSTETERPLIRGSLLVAIKSSWRPHGTGSADVRWGGGRAGGRSVGGRWGLGPRGRRPRGAPPWGTRGAAAGRERGPTRRRTATNGTG